MSSQNGNRIPWSEVLGPGVRFPEQAIESSSAPSTDSTTSPPKALMLAMLKDAISCFQEELGYARARAHMLARQAERWIRSRDWNSPFSFNSVCETLGIDPDCLRDALLRTKYGHLTGKSEDERPGDRRNGRAQVASLSVRVKSARR